MTYHKGALLMNRLEIAVSILQPLSDFCSVRLGDDDFSVSIQTDGAQNISILQDLCNIFNEIHIFWSHKVMAMQRNTIALPIIGARETNQMGTGSVGRPTFVIPKEVRKPTCQRFL